MFPIAAERREVDEGLLERMRKLIAWPESVGELRQTLANLPQALELMPPRLGDWKGNDS